MKKVVLVIAFLLFSCFSFYVKQSVAMPISINFSATVSEISSSTPFGIPMSVGDSVIGNLTYINEGEDQNGSPTLGAYLQPHPADLSVTINNVTFSVAPTIASFLQVSNNTTIGGSPGSNTDQFHFHQEGESVIDGIQEAGQFGQFDSGITFAQSAGTAFNDISIPIISDLSIFEATDGRFWYGGFDSIRYNNINIVSEPDQNPIPEPATIALLAIGIAGLAGAEVRRRRKKQAVDNS